MIDGSVLPHFPVSLIFLSTIVSITERVAMKTVVTLLFFCIIQMNRSEGVLDVLSALLKAWSEELKKYDEKDSLGTVTYGKPSADDPDAANAADAGGVVWTLFNDMKEVGS